MKKKVLHEWLGIAVFLLFLLHHGLNWRWYKNLLGGRYSAVRLGSLLVNVLLFALMFAVPVSGLARAEHVSLLHSILGFDVSFKHEKWISKEKSKNTFHVLAHWGKIR